MLAVTKGFGVGAIVAALAAGFGRIGENYAQELIPKVTTARQSGITPEVHFIGHLQTNKVRQMAPVVDVWQTVDRASALSEVAKRAPGARVYIQVNSTGEDAKAGCPPADVEALVEGAVGAGLVVVGLMTMGPTDQDPGRTRAAFRLTRGVADRLGLSGCSMGMSDDYEVAIEEGSTLVRVGRAIFGARPAP